MKNLIKSSLIIACTLVAASCRSQIATTEEHVNSYIGTNISVARELYLTPSNQSIGAFESKVYAWEETQQKFKNGDTLYTFSDPYRDYTVNWIAGPDGIIKSGSYSGKDTSR